MKRNVTQFDKTVLKALDILDSGDYYREDYVKEVADRLRSALRRRFPQYFDSHGCVVTDFESSPVTREEKARV